ncbi:hypothetical protein [Carnimonas bestiolae]|uniref:hypothetical protein n=1 Tax=Carnimonas bestiolae TaxID=3402172 RepID=UPI003EDB6E1E
MPTSGTGHPSRDALLRDSYNQLREQRGVTLESFVLALNDLVHAVCPLKVADQPALRSFTAVTPEMTRAIGAWTKRVQRWANGDTEFPAWLEEPWAMALEQFGDDTVRQQLINRHGMVGIKLPTAENTSACGFQAMGAIADGMGQVISIYAQMMEDGILDTNDAALAKQLMPLLKKAISDLVAGGMLVNREVFGTTVQ